MMTPYFRLYPTFLSRQQDNDGANDDENTLIFFPDKHRTYEIPQRKQFVHQESIRTVNYMFSSTLSFNTFTFISAAIG